MMEVLFFACFTTTRPIFRVSPPSGFFSKLYFLNREQKNLKHDANSVKIKLYVSKVATSAVWGMFERSHHRFQICLVFPVRYIPIPEHRYSGLQIPIPAKICRYLPALRTSKNGHFCLFVCFNASRQGRAPDLFSRPTPRLHS
jgi:hypothetical protein